MVGLLQPFSVLCITNTRADYAVLVIAIHSALQVFNPCPPASSDGLHPHRHIVYAGSIIFPTLMSALAFVNPDVGYYSLGAFCTLPIRPFWYRLALQWIPRYIIALIILGLATAIYTYVGFEFRRYSNTSQDFKSSLMTMETTSSRDDRAADAWQERRVCEMMEQKPLSTRRASSIAHDIVSPQPRASSISFMHEGPFAGRAASVTLATFTQSQAEALPGSPPQRSGSIRPPLYFIPSGYTIRPATSADSLRIVALPQPNSGTQDDTNDEDIGPLQQGPPSRPPSPTSPGQRQMERQRARIHRQLRLLFIYPIVYTLMWLLPFVHHCLNYQDKYILQPIWFFRLGSQICLASMGFVDCLIFSLREKPWKNIPTSDGTLWGSFAVWRSSGATRVNSFVREVAGGRLSLQNTLAEGGPLQVRNAVRTSASNDQTRMMSEQAKIRLELEKEERLAAIRARIASEAGLDEGSSSEEFGVTEGDPMVDEVMRADYGKGKGKARAEQV